MLLQQACDYTHYRNLHLATICYHMKTELHYFRISMNIKQNACQNFMSNPRTSFLNLKNIFMIETLKYLLENCTMKHYKKAFVSERTDL